MLGVVFAVLAYLDLGAAKRLLNGLELRVSDVKGVVDRLEHGALQQILDQHRRFVDKTLGQDKNPDHTLGEDGVVTDPEVGAP